MQPGTAQEVAEALAIIKKTGSKFAIRTGGHTPNPGFSSVDETGVVIDLRRLNSISLDENNLLRAGAGSTWGQVYPFLEGKQLSATGGRDPAVGVAGFLLGGVYFMSRCLLVSSANLLKVGFPPCQTSLVWEQMALRTFRYVM